MTSNENDCTICYEPLCSSQSPIGAVIPCGHLFHFECFQHWESTNMQTQLQRNGHMNPRNVIVKCPSCNTESRRNSSTERLLKVYINFEEFKVSSCSESEDDSSEDAEDEARDYNVQQAPSDNTTSPSLIVNARRNTATPNHNDNDNPIMLLSSSDEEDEHDDDINPNANEDPAVVHCSSSSRSRNQKKESIGKKLSKKQLKQRIKVLRKQKESLKEKAKSYNDLNLNHIGLQKELKQKQKEMEKLKNEYHRDLTSIERLKRTIDDKDVELSVAQCKIASLQDEKSLSQRIRTKMEADYQRKAQELQVNNMNEFKELVRENKSLRKKNDGLALLWKQADKERTQLEKELEEYKHALSGEASQKVLEMKRNPTESQSSYSRNKKAWKQTFESTINDFDEMDRMKAKREQEQQQKRDHKNMRKKISVHARKIEQAVSSKKKIATHWDLPRVEMSASNNIEEASHTLPNTRLSHLKPINGNSYRRGMTFPTTSRQRTSSSSCAFQQEVLPSLKKRKNSNESRSSKLKDNDIRSIFKRQNSL